MNHPTPNVGQILCRPGHEARANDLLHELDRWNITVPELLAEACDPPYDVYPAELLTLWWRTAWTFRPDLLLGRRPSTLVYAWIDHQVGYDVDQKIDGAVKSVSEGQLISSLRQDGTHHPALDLDYPATLHADASGVRYLRIEPSSPALDRHGPEFVTEADSAAEALGMTRCARPEGTLADLAVAGEIVSSLAGGWHGDWDSLWEAGANLSHPLRSVVRPGGVWYRIDGDAMLVRSTSWNHLYIRREVDAATYIRAVDVMAGCGLLNPGFANAARDRGYTALRRPGLRKPDPTPLPVDEIPF